MIAEKDLKVGTIVIGYAKGRGITVFWEGGLELTRTYMNGGIK